MFHQLLRFSAAAAAAAAAAFVPAAASTSTVLLQSCCFCHPDRYNCSHRCRPQQQQQEHQQQQQRAGVVVVPYNWTRRFAVKVTVRIVGKKNSGEKWIEQGCQMYETRLKPNNVDTVTEWYKTNDALVKSVLNDGTKSSTTITITTAAASTAPIVLLDPTLGKECSSELFSTLFYQWAEQGGSRLLFVIGGAEGLPKELFVSSQDSSSIRLGGGSSSRSKLPVYYLSLSKLTFTHQFARLVLLEQIYRATEIVRRRRRKQQQKQQQTPSNCLWMRVMAFCIACFAFPQALTLVVCRLMFSWFFFPLLSLLLVVFFSRTKIAKTTIEKGFKLS